MRGDSPTEQQTDDAGRPTTARDPRPYSTLAFVEDLEERAPLEEAIRPPWFSDEYSNENISDLYQRLFGCDAIVTRAPRRANGEAHDIESAIDSIEEAYRNSVTAAEGRALAPWIYALTSRRTASLVEVLTQAPDTPGEEQGAAFHFYAGGNFTKFEGLGLKNPTDADGEPVRLRPPFLGSTSREDEYYEVFSGSDLDDLDPRAERYAVALAYRNELGTELKRGRGFRG